MDLHLTDAQATAEERAAVDSELGAPGSSWQGGRAANHRHARGFQRRQPLAGASASARAACHSEPHWLDQPRRSQLCRACGWTSPPPKFTAWRRSMECFRSSPVLRSSPTSAMTSPASRGARTNSAPNWNASLAPQVPLRQRTRDLAAQPMPGSVRARSGGAGQLGRRETISRSAGSGFGGSVSVSAERCCCRTNA